MSDLKERLHDAALEPSVEFNWDGTVRRATRRRRVRAGGLAAGVLTAAVVVTVGGLQLLDGDSDRRTVIATQPPTTEPSEGADDDVSLNERWVIAPVPEGFILEDVRAEASDIGSSTTTTARFRSDDGAELLVRDHFGDAVPALGEAWFEAEGVEEREIAFTEEPVQEAGYRAAGEVDEYQHLGWRYSEDGTLEILYSESLSLADARAFAAALRRTASTETPATTVPPTGAPPAFPPAAASVAHGGTTWAVVLDGVIGFGPDPALDAAVSAAADAGYSAGPTDCDLGADAALGLPADADVTTVSVYFDTEADAVAAEAAFAARGVDSVVAQVQTFCLE